MYSVAILAQTLQSLVELPRIFKRWGRWALGTVSGA